MSRSCSVIRMPSNMCPNGPERNWSEMPAEGVGQLSLDEGEEVSVREPGEYTASSLSV